MIIYSQREGETLKGKEGTNDDLQGTGTLQRAVRCVRLQRQRRNPGQDLQDQGGGWKVGQGESLTHRQKNLKKFQKSVDKPAKLW